MTYYCSEYNCVVEESPCPYCSADHSTDEEEPQALSA